MVQAVLSRFMPRPEVGGVCGKGLSEHRSPGSTKGYCRTLQLASERHQRITPGPLCGALPTKISEISSERACLRLLVQ